MLFNFLGKSPTTTTGLAVGLGPLDHRSGFFFPPSFPFHGSALSVDCPDVICLSVYDRPYDDTLPTNPRFIHLLSKHCVCVVKFTLLYTLKLYNHKTYTHTHTHTKTYTYTI